MYKLLLLLLQVYRLAKLIFYFSFKIITVNFNIIMRDVNLKFQVFVGLGNSMQVFEAVCRNRTKQRHKSNHFYGRFAFRFVMF